jgi:hypothetical protein
VDVEAPRLAAVERDIASVRQHVQRQGETLNLISGEMITIRTLPESVTKLRVDVGRIKGMLAACTVFLAVLQLGLQLMGK